MVDIKRYEVYLDVDYKNLIYKGKEYIYIDNDKEFIELNVVDLKILDLKVNDKNIDYEYKNNKLIIKSGKFSGAVYIEFEGKIPERLSGIYKAEYDNNYIITTQFESIHCREFIPCIDDPSYKAEFEFTIVVDKDLDVIFNTPIESLKVEGNKKVIKFKKTPKMSTYLLYLGIGKFEEIRDFLNSIEIIIATIPGKVTKGRFALEVTKSSLSFYEKYFNISYQLPKLHLIAVPQFAFGAMENWGAITFRETALLADEKSSFKQRQNVALIIAHELAHQWFGNLVTMKWWDDLWLNESFATFMSYKAINNIYPNWEIWTDFVRSEMEAAMLKDSLITTHPIHAEIRSEEEIEQIFDDISYGKGANILRMIEGYIGEGSFREGVRNYLKKFSYSNAKAEDLWQSLEEASGKPVSEIMKDWVMKKGYPVVNVNVEGSKLKLSQERFTLNPYSELSETIYYPIPLTLEVNGKRYTHLMTKPEETITFESTINTLKVNLDRTGFYRVYYENMENLDIKSFNQYEAWGLINDYFYFYLSSKIKYKDYEYILSQLLTRREPLIVLGISDQLSLLWSINREKYGRLSIDYHSTQLKYYTIRNTDIEKKVYGILAERLARFDDKFSLGLSELFNSFHEIDPNMKDASAIAYAIAYEDEAYDVLLDKYRRERYDEDKLIILKGMLWFRKPELVINTLSLALTREIKRQDVARLLPIVAHNPFSRKAVWKWIKTNIEFLRGLYKGVGTLGRVLEASIPLLGIESPDVESFFISYNIPEAIIGIKSGLEVLKAYKRIF